MLYLADRATITSSKLFYDFQILRTQVQSKLHSYLQRVAPIIVPQTTRYLRIARGWSDGFGSGSIQSQAPDVLPLHRLCLESVGHFEGLLLGRGAVGEG